MIAADTALDMSAGVPSSPKLPAVPETVVSFIAMCNIMVAHGNAAPSATTKPALMKTTTGAALEAYRKELAEAQKQAGSQWESMGVCRGDREIRLNCEMQTFMYRSTKALGSVPEKIKMLRNCI